MTDETRAEERRQLRPYRRFVGVLFGLAVLIVCGAIFRGMIRHLDRLPSVDTFRKLDSVDVRALRACAEDLKRLQTQIQAAAGRTFATLPAAGEPGANAWEAVAEPLELQRLKIVARCRLDEPSDEPVVDMLNTAAHDIEAVLRSYALLYGRHKNDGQQHARDARESLQQATTILNTR